MLNGIFSVDNVTSSEHPKRASRKESYATVVVLVLIVLASIYYYSVNQPKAVLTPNVTVTLYAGEINSNEYGFGFAANSLTAPGPTLTFKVGDVVKVTVHNVGTLPHSFEINTQNTTKGQALFSSEINPGTFISPGKSASIVFKVTEAGEFYYICPVPGHAELGMWGHCKITS
jgi:uncharacterized cupredoxin-like copper-binding protein